MGDTKRGLPEALKRVLRGLGAPFAALAAGVRRRPKLTIGVVVVLLLGGGGAAAVMLIGPEEVIESAQDVVGMKPLSLTELQARAKAEPKNAAVLRDLGHGYFAAGSRTTALKVYSAALGFDPKIGDSTMVANLVASFGKKEQSAAAGIITRFKIADADDALAGLTKNRSYGVRWEAVRALEKLGKSNKVDYTSVYELDLQLNDCDVRRRAVEKLGVVGDKGSLDLIRAAAKKDADETPWYKSSCLGDLPEEVEKKIMARK